MAQRDKVKELVGRGLNSYHTKSLQQMDRIEKKNKEQNHKISILSNELDNDYLTKTEEGSVISLEHSKEGMVYLDELQGNTLVNYCTDGLKELTLNGDIDVEGTFVTTTEGVDNGLVDVSCEGNTLVNVANGRWRKSGNATSTFNDVENGSGATTATNGSLVVLKDGFFKDNTTYTVIADINSSMITNDITFYNGVSFGQGRINLNNDFSNGYTRIIKKVTTTTNCIAIVFGYHGSAEVGKYINVKNLVVLEGDWTNKEVPTEYFEGMKSVGELEDNKIEILSKNKNLFKNASLSTETSWETFRGTIVEGINNNKGIYSEHIQTLHGYYDFLQQNIFLKDNINNAIKNDTWYTFSFYAKGTGKVRTHIYPNAIDTSIKGFVNGVEKNLQSDGNCDWELTNEWVRYSYTFKTKSNINDMGTYAKALFRLMSSDTDILNTVTISCPMLEKGKVATNFVNDLSNKKEILLNKPLRGLPNGVCDKFVKQGGNWYVERNCGEIVFNGSEGSWMASSTNGNVATSLFYIKQSDRLAQSIGLCDRFSTLSGYGTNEPEGIFYGSDINIRINVNKLKTNDLKGFKEWLQQNPTTIVYQLATPTYEEITDPQVITYLDTTHISNNSTIPCNMQTKNSGYNTIIKPSTQYTVALDTNKSGTIGINLGGAKVTTTNNVAIITTPATLADDSLRLYGKGIKVSKVRLLEGDKTNYIPSFFEGMKSSFEDKLQEDGTYKMEILSNNKNLFDINGRFVTSNNVLVEKNNDTLIISNESGQANWQQHNIFIRGLQHNKTYLVNIGDLIIQNNFEQMDRYAISIYEETRNLHLSNIFDANKKQCRFSVPLGARLDKISLRIHITTNSPIVNKITVKNIQISEVDSCIIDRKFNKIQFSSIEPLRGIENIKDKFVFKDGKLMIQRNLGEVVLDGNHNCSYAMYDLIMNHYNVYFRMTNVVTNKKTGGLVDNDKLPTYKTILYSEDVCGFGTNDKWFENGFSLRLPRIIVGNGTDTEILNKCKQWLAQNPIKAIYQLEEPTYEEIPFELQKIILEGYENGTLFFDTNIPPTVTVTYAGETPIVKSVKLNKTEVLNNTEDINDNIIPYLMDMDYRVVMLQLATEELEGGVSMARLFGGTYEMIKRDILSKRLTREEYGYRLADYYNAGKLTEEQVRELEELR